MCQTRDMGGGSHVPFCLVPFALLACYRGRGRKIQDKKGQKGPEN